MSVLTALEVRRACPELESSLRAFFRDLSASPDSQFFHPHPFTDEEASRICHYSGRDLYYLMLDGDDVLGYGLLRGWDEGYDVPMLGIVLASSAKGTGLARTLMQFLHAAARRRGARCIRLKVYMSNVRALRLYQSLGYVFCDEAACQSIGTLQLD